MLWRCLGIDELADIREKHHIADCGCNRIQRAETHYPFYHFEMEWMVSLYTILFVFALSFYCLEYLPVLDFRPYKIGVNIKAGMEIPEGAKPSVFESRFVLEKTAGSRNSHWIIIRTARGLLLKRVPY